MKVFIWVVLIFVGGALVLHYSGLIDYLTVVRDLRTPEYQYQDTRIRVPFDMGDDMQQDCNLVLKEHRNGGSYGQQDCRFHSHWYLDTR